MKVSNWFVRAKCTAIAVATMMVCLLVVGFTAEQVLRIRLTQRETHELEVKAGFLAIMLATKGEPALHDGKLLFGTTVADSNDKLVDDFARQLDGSSVAIYRGDMLVAGSPLRDGRRPLGTKLPAGPARDSVLVLGEPYTGVSNVDGEDRFTSLQPIRDHDGHVVGALAFGNDLSTFTDAINALVWPCVVTAIAAHLAAALQIFLFTRRIPWDGRERRRPRPSHPFPAPREGMGPGAV